MRKGGEEFILHAADAFGFGAGGFFTFEKFFAFAENAFDAGHIAGDLGNADDMSIRVFDGGNGDGNIQGASVLADADRFKMIDPLPAAELLQDFGFFIKTVRREQDGDGLADHFLGGVAEHSLGGLIPTSDDAVEVFADDGVVGGGDDRLEPAFQFDGLGDVAGDFGGSDDFSIGVTDRGDGDGYGDGGAVFAETNGLEVIDPLAALKAFEDFGLFVEAVGREKNGNGLSDDLVGGVSEDALGRWVPTSNHAVEVFADDGVIRGR